MRVAKTEEVKIIQLNYGYGWEDESTYTKSEYENIKNDFKEYKLHAFHYGARIRLITRRIKKMTFKEAKKEFLRDLLIQNKCLTIAELKKAIGSTTIRCYWVDYVDYLAKDGHITERQRNNWGQVI